jgi:hypothetical protein
VKARLLFLPGIVVGAFLLLSAKAYLERLIGTANAIIGPLQNDIDIVPLAASGDATSGPQAGSVGHELG